MAILTITSSRDIKRLLRTSGLGHATDRGAYQGNHASQARLLGSATGADKPETLIVPEVLQGDRLTLEGKTLNVMGLKGPQPDRSFVWIPSIKAVVGGVVVAGNLHVWMADTQTAQSHTGLAWRRWRKSKHLHPKTVVPGHFAAGTPMTVAAVKYTRDYIKAFDAETARAQILPNSLQP